MGIFFLHFPRANNFAQFSHGAQNTEIPGKITCEKLFLARFSGILIFIPFFSFSQKFSFAF